MICFWRFNRKPIQAIGEGIGKNFLSLGVTLIRCIKQHCLASRFIYRAAFA